MNVDTEDVIDSSPVKPRWWLWLGVAAVAGIVAVFAYSQMNNTDAATTTTFASLGSLTNAAPSSNEPAPDFSVETLDGSGFTLSEHMSTDGRPVFLNLWASWCFPCRAEMPAIDAAAQNHPHVKFVGVSVNDDRVAATDFARSIGVRYTIGFDDDGTVAAGYPVLGMPGTFLISSEGKIVRTIFGGVDEKAIATYVSENFDL